MTKVKDVIAAMERLAPPALALEGDPIGLHAGNPEKRTNAVLLALDATLPVLEEAKRIGAGMIVAHHPRLYRRLATLADTDPAGARAAAMARSGLAVYSAHTNLDLAPGGTNDLLADIVGIADARVLKPEKSEKLVKLAVFVPVSRVEQVREAVCRAGAGAIGAYSDCTFRSRGTGTFRCGKGTKPFIGRPGSYEEVDEFRLETVVGEFTLNAVVAAMRAAHPYEEPAYDLYPLLQPAAVYGLGRVGELERRETLSGLAARLAKATGSRMAQYHGKPDARPRVAAAWAGGGVDVAAVLRSGAEVLVAGEVGFHDLEAFAERGVAVVTLGHGHSEEPVLAPLATRLGRELPGLAVRVAKKAGYAFLNCP